MLANIFLLFIRKRAIQPGSIRSRKQILLEVLLQYILVTDRQTHGRTD